MAVKNSVCKASCGLLLIIGLCFFSTTVMGQPKHLSDPSLTLPKPSEIERITIEPGTFDAYTPETLLQTMPKLVATEGLYLSPKFPQRGSIILKNGEVRRWIAIDNHSLELQGEKCVRLFIVPGSYRWPAPKRRSRSR